MSDKMVKNDLVISIKDFNPFISVKETFIENWYKKLEKETIKSFFIPLSKRETIACLLNAELGVILEETYPLNIKEKSTILENLLHKIKINLNLLNDKAFFRLNSRSAKDSWYGLGKIDLPYFKNKGLVLQSIDVLRWMGDSERIFEDLIVFLDNSYPPQIILREWIEIKRHEEFRCFILNSELKGISQYYHISSNFQTNYFPELLNRIDFYKESIIEYFNRIKRIINLKNYVLDIFFFNDKPKILELNPLCELTDPCLFDWELDSFEISEFRYITEKPIKNEEKSLLDVLMEN